VHIAHSARRWDGRIGMRCVEDINGEGYRFIAPVMCPEAERCYSASQASSAEHTHNDPVAIAMSLAVISR
jgi:DNA-binding winged helix-turn-helix (wHTH) protein